MNAKFFIFIATISTITSNLAQAEFLDQYGIARWDNGQARRTSRYGGEKICTKYGMRLPAILELADLSKASGLLVKHDHQLTESEKDSMKLFTIVKQRPGHSPLYMHMYYSNQNYIQPAGDLGKHLFWSSSDSLYYNGEGMLLDAVRGEIESYRSTYADPHAVRCVQL